jgi:uncharacterized protein with NRDE domain
VCTLALYFRVLEEFPLLIAANRDEQYDRPSVAPYPWPTTPVIVAGKDLRAGGTWLGVNEHGLAVAILNRRETRPSPAAAEGQDRGASHYPSTATNVTSRTRAEPRHPGTERDFRGTTTASDPAPSIRSRGLLCLDVLRLKTATEGIEFVRGHRQRYQPFTLVFADSRDAWAVTDVQGELALSRLDDGLHVFSNTTDVHLQSEKSRRVRRQFATIEETLRSHAGDCLEWPQLFLPALKDHSFGNGSADPKDAICVHGDASGTVSSSIIVCRRSKRQVETFFCAGPPCRGYFELASTLKIH